MFLSWRKSLEDITDVDPDPKRKFVSFKVIPSNDRIFCVYAPSGHNISEQLVTRHFLEGLRNYIENKGGGNKNKKIFGDFNCTMDKIYRDGRNFNTKALEIWFKSSLVKTPWIMDSKIYREGITQIPLSLPTTIDSLAQDPQ